MQDIFLKQFSFAGISFWEKSPPIQAVNWLNDEGDKFQARPLNACRREAITVSLFFCMSNPPRHPPSQWIVIRCARNIKKDGARFGVRVWLWWSYGKIEDCKQSSSSWTSVLKLPNELKVKLHVFMMFFAQNICSRNQMKWLYNHGQNWLRQNAKCAHISPLNFPAWKQGQDLINEFPPHSPHSILTWGSAGRQASFCGEKNIYKGERGVIINAWLFMVKVTTQLKSVSTVLTTIVWRGFSQFSRKHSIPKISISFFRYFSSKRIS